MRAVMGDWFLVQNPGREADAIAFRDRQGNFHQFEPSTGKLHHAGWLRHSFADPEHRRAVRATFTAVSRERAQKLVEQQLGQFRDRSHVEALKLDRFALVVSPRVAFGAREVLPRPAPVTFAEIQQPTSILVDADPHAVFQLDEHDVPASVLTDDGCLLKEILADRTPLDTTRVQMDDLRKEAWRIIGRVEEGRQHRLGLAAPDPDLVDSWQVLWLSRHSDDEGWTLDGGHEQRLRPGRSTRRAGVELRWSCREIAGPASGLESLTVQLRNIGRRTWDMDPGDHRLAVAWITTVDGDPLDSIKGFTYSRAGAMPSLDLRTEPALLKIT